MINLFSHFSWLGYLYNEVPMGYGQISNQAVPEKYFWNNCQGKMKNWDGTYYFMVALPIL